jgi:hypothetical protein
MIVGVLKERIEDEAHEQTAEALGLARSPRRTDVISRSENDREGARRWQCGRVLRLSRHSWRT